MLSNHRFILGLLVSLCILFAIFLVIITFCAWIYLQRKKKQIDEGEEKDFLLPLPSSDDNKDLSTAKRRVPITCSTSFQQEDLKPNTIIQENEFPSDSKTHRFDSLRCATSFALPFIPDEQMLQEAKVRRSSFREKKGETFSVSNNRSLHFLSDHQESQGRYPPLTGKSRSLPSLPSIMEGSQDASRSISPTLVSGHQMNCNSSDSVISKYPSTLNLGKITIKAFYISKSKELKINVVNAYDLAPGRNMMGINVFVCVKLVPLKREKYYTTPLPYATKEPSFNEIFHFHEIDKDHLSSLRVNLKVCNQKGKDSIRKRREILGEAEVPLGNMGWDREVVFAGIALKPHECKVTASAISISLSYEATKSTLIVIVHSAIFPKTRNVFQQSNPVAVVTLYEENGSFETKETVAKNLSSNPQCEEQLTFKVHTTADKTLEKYFLHVALRQKRYLGYGDTIGKVVLGSMVSQESAQEQWKKVVEVPHTLHKAEHVLLPV